MTITHVVAAAENGTIGVQGDLPWDIPEDLKFFKDKTKGHALIMGRKTFESIGRPLPHRLNVVVTRQKDYQPEGVLVASSIDEAIEICKAQLDQYGDVIDIVGGGEIYKQSMDLVDEIYLTRIHKDVDGDTKYPDVNESLFELVEKRDRFEPVEFSFLKYIRKIN